MDCLCCADGGQGPTSETEFLGSICNLDNGKAKFPAEDGRYVMYVIAGCPFAARPWSVLSFYGIPSNSNTHGLRVIKLFPAAHDDGWFLQPVSQGEQDLLHAFPDAKCDSLTPTPEGCTPLDPRFFPEDKTTFHHISQLYEFAKPGFQGAKSVPLLWDTKSHTIVSNSSLGLSEMIATQMAPTMATRNQHIRLFPSCQTDDENEKQLYLQHKELVKQIHSEITTAVYKINSVTDGGEHDRMVNDYYSALETYQTQIVDNGGYLMGTTPKFVDLLLLASLVRLDLAYQWRFGLGRKSIRENYPGLMKYMTGMLEMEGMMGDCILPRDIMALYWMTPKWVNRTLPLVPETWEVECVGGSCEWKRKDDDREDGEKK
mmetsp:Transcript_2897/g.5968  ORF Transcript_2897/g.5968 Transcript_2897/m.5968 type:complete len:373 (+) Transcript_2897:96-1214(+)